MEKTGSKKAKLLLGAAVPLIAIIITLIMVGASFAWFANVSAPTVQTVRLNTQKAFILSFTADKEANERNINYKGQTAIGSDGKLVTEYNGQTGGLLGSRLEQYMLDAPYYFITTVALDTENTVIDMNMTLDSAKITSGNTTIESYDIAAGSKYPQTDIPYVFTWYFKEHVETADGDVKNYTGTLVSEDDDRRVMADYKPSGGEVWYTPYGQLTFGENGLVSKVNGEDADGYSALAEGLRDVSIIAENKSFDFYIVFAPEKLFWSQFFAEDREKSVSDIYTSQEEQKRIFGSSSQNQMYYSNTRYYGTTFEFGAMITVTAMHSAPDQPQGNA